MPAKDGSVNPPISTLLAQAVAEHRRGNLAAAEELYRQILAGDTNNADALHLLGIIAHQSGRSDLAEPLIRRAIVLRPDAAIFHNNLGEALRALGKRSEAAACYERALQIDPDYTDPHVNLGTILQAQGHSAQAIEHYRAALAANPAHADAHLNLGIALHAAGDLDASAAAQHRAIELSPRSAKAHNNLGVVLMELGRAEEARQHFRQAMEFDPSFAPAASNLLLSLHYDRGDCGAALLDEHVKWAKARAAEDRPLTPGLSPAHRGEGETRRVRIGYVSPDFVAHPVAFFIEPLLANHDRDRFEVFCYSDATAPDEVTARLAAYTDNWRQTPHLSDDQFAAAVRADGIDILIELAGHTAGNRLLAFTRRLSPVQITYLGYPGTTGLDAMDYRLTDEICDPPGQTEAFHTERLLRIRPPLMCYRPSADSPDVSQPPSASGSPITFGSFNNFAKVTETMLRLWARILHDVPRSRLLLKSKALGGASARDRVIPILAGEGIDAARVELLPQEPSYRQHLATYARIDVALDTYPYCGTTTTCEALWMGVPAITLAGPTHASRVGATILNAVGLGEFIADTEDEYVSAAVRLANGAPHLSELRASLRDRIQRSPLCDERGFTRAIESGLRSCLALREPPRRA